MNETTDLPLDTARSWKILALNTIAFTVCFAAWMMNGVLLTFLVENEVPITRGWSSGPWFGLLMAIPVLTGALFRLPIGVLTDKYGGRIVYGVLLIAAAVPMYAVSLCNSYWQLFAAGLGFGFCGTSFAVGIAYTSVWFSKHRQGTALGIFGAGNAGAALTQIFAPRLLNTFTDNANPEKIEGWRNLPIVYAAVLAIMGVVFLALTNYRIPAGSAGKTLKQRLEPLRHMRVWRFGMYYFFVFGGFVALAQWLVPYYVNVYTVPVATAGMLAAVNTMPSGVIRAAGGWMSDRWGARAVMYWVFGLCLLCAGLMIVPRMDINTPGKGVLAKRAGTVTAVRPGTGKDSALSIVEVTAKTGTKMEYKVKNKTGVLFTEQQKNDLTIVWPSSMSWQEVAVKVGDKVPKKGLIARGVTHIYFQANIWIFTVLSLLLGSMMGIGKAGVYKHIPDYFPNDVGVVGGIVGVLGGLGGFVCPPVFSYLLDQTGLWTTCWMFFFVLIAACLFWMHLVVRKMMKAKAPHLVRHIENDAMGTPGWDASGPD